MSQADKFYKHISSGQPTKYEETKHIKLLFELFSEGKDVASFCARSWINHDTFFVWLKKHTRFKKAYDVARKIAQEKWEEIPFTNPNFNFPHWHLIMRNRFGLSKSKINLSEKKKATEMMQSAKDHLSEDKITVSDYTAIVNSAKVQAIIDGEVFEEGKIERPSTKEELLEKKALLEDIIETQKKLNSNKK